MSSESDIVPKEETLKLIGERLREARKSKKLSQRALADKIKGQSKTQICDYEKGRRAIPRNLIVDFAQALDVSPSYLSAYDKVSPNEEEQPTPTNLVPMSEFHKGSLVGDIACGVPLNQEESEEVLLPFGADLALYCRGDSMINIGIGDGDIVYIRRLDGFDELINGRIAAVGIGDDYEYTLKRWFYNETARTLKLVPENDEYKTLTFRGEELADIHLLGVAVGYTSVL